MISTHAHKRQEIKHTKQFLADWMFDYKSKEQIFSSQKVNNQNWNSWSGI